MKGWQRNRTFLRGLGTICAAVSVIAGGAWLAGIRWNETPSLPTGLWRLTSAAEITRGQIVAFCPDLRNPVLATGAARGYLAKGGCSGGAAPMYKRVVGLPGDRVSQSAAGVLVNGSLVPLSKAHPADGMGRPLGAWRYDGSPLPAHQLVVLSDYTALSFDSRYFGPIDASAVIGQATPLWIDDDKELGR